MLGRTRWGRAALATTAVLAGFSAGYVLTNERVSTIAQDPAPEVATDQEVARQVAARPQAGTELLAIFVASSTCGAAQYPGLKDALHRIRMRLSAEAEREQKRLVSVGVALDHDPWLGIAFLEDFGPFDEVLSGRKLVEHRLRRIHRARLSRSPSASATDPGRAGYRD